MVKQPKLALNTFRVKRCYNNIYESVQWASLKMKTEMVFY